MNFFLFVILLKGVSGSISFKTKTPGIQRPLPYQKTINSAQALSVAQELGEALRKPCSIPENKRPKIAKAFHIVKKDKLFWTGVYLRSSIGRQIAPQLTYEERLIVIRFFHENNNIEEIKQFLLLYGIVKSDAQISNTLEEVTEKIFNQVAETLDINV